MSPILKINDKVIDRITYFNFLGVTFDDTLTWNSQTGKIAKK